MEADRAGERPYPQGRERGIHLVMTVTEVAQLQGVGCSQARLGRPGSVAPYTSGMKVWVSIGGRT